MKSKIISVNVGLPSEVMWRGKVVRTAIFKEPVEGLVRVRKLGLEGDAQADLTVHGGPYKAVYGYPSEHYGFWKSEWPNMEINWGAFGENLTTEGLLEDELHIGDRLRAGSAEFAVTQPRFPCYKLGIRFGSAEMIKRFMLSGFSGFYFTVLKEGQVRRGDKIEILSRKENEPTIREVFES